jgi:hypothetical protein
LLVFAGSAALYVSTIQARQFGDSSLLYQEFAAHPDGGGYWYHALYMPAAGLLGRVLDGLTPPQVLKALAAGCGALGAACAYVLARLWRAPPTAALLAAALLALSPGYWFFATTVEVHTLHAVCVGLCALAVLAAPWRRPLVAAALAACTLPILFPSHQSALLLGPGFVALAQHARSLRGLAPLRWRTLLLGVGPMYLAGMLAGIPLAAWLCRRPVTGLLGGTHVALEEFQQGFSVGDTWTGWLQPLGLLLPIALAGVFGGRFARWSLAAPLAFVLPSALFFVLWGLPERGGYTLGSSMFLVVLAAAGLSRPGSGARWLGALALAAQAAWAFTALRAYDAPEWGARLRERRQAIVEAIGERGGVISLNITFQYIEAALPDVVELSLVTELVGALDRGEGPEQFIAAVEPRLESFLARPDFAVVLDQSHRPTLERVAPLALSYDAALQAWLAQRCRLVPVAGSEWPLLLVERTPDGGILPPR